MTAVGSAGATSHRPMDWHRINWHAVHRNVRRLQARIVQATQGGRWGKVHALQHLLTHSCSGKALGRQTGDGKSWQIGPRVWMAHMGHPRPEDGGHSRAATTGVSSPPAAARIYSEKQRHEAPSWASPRCTTAPCRPSPSLPWTPLPRPPPIRTPTGFAWPGLRRTPSTKAIGCSTSLTHPPGSSKATSSLFRPHQPCLALDPCPHGQEASCTNG